MATHDQMFRTEAAYLALGKYPYIYFADMERAATGSQGYINNSLEGTEFDASQAGPGTITISTGVFTPNWYIWDVGTAMYPITAASINSTGVLTITTSGVPSYAVGDLAAVNGIVWDTTHPFVNGVWTVLTSSGTTTTLQTSVTGYTLSFSLSTGKVSSGQVFQIRDNRAYTDAKGNSFTSIIFTPKMAYETGVSYKRILPSDIYTRFRFVSDSATIPAGGINSNLFNVVDSSNNNIKPVLWAYFFGYNDQTIGTRPQSCHFEIAFNSYALVLRPSGSGASLEFALVKFNWGTITTGVSGSWMTNIVGTDKFNKWTVEGTDLGYLISTNPLVNPVGTTPVVSEIAVSDSFTYSSETPAEFNLKITVRKHLLSDSELDGTYLVNLMINDDYNICGENVHYDSVLHGYIEKPDPVYNTTDGTHPHDCMLMPMFYFKFNNVDEQYVNVELPFANPPVRGSSKILLDSLFFRQLNAAAVNAAGISYLY